MEGFTVSQLAVHGAAPSRDIPSAVSRTRRRRCARCWSAWRAPATPPLYTPRAAAGPRRLRGRRRRAGGAPAAAGRASRTCSCPRATARALPARLYAPAATTALPVLLYFHGGGFTIGSVASHDILCRTLAQLAGCAVVSVGYRLAPEHRFPTAVHDAWDATAVAGARRRPPGPRHGAAWPSAATAPAARWPRSAPRWRATPACRCACSCCSTRAAPRSRDAPSHRALPPGPRAGAGPHRLLLRPVHGRWPSATTGASRR